MPFTGTPIVKEITDNLVRITGISLAGGDSGTIGLHEAVPIMSVSPDIRLPVGFKPRIYEFSNIPALVSLQDSVQVYFNYILPGSVVPVVSVVKTGTTPQDFLIVMANTSAGPAALLGGAQGFGVLAASTITNTGASVITGDLGLSPGTSVTGFPPGTVTGTQHITDPQAAAAQSDATVAYVALAALTPSTDLTGQDLGGLTLPPGNYHFDTSAQLTGTLTLDAANDPGATWVFQIGSTLTTASASVVALVNGALAGNVFWQVGSSATLGTTTTFKGTIIAQASITADTGASVTDGRLIALTGAVTLDTNAITVPPAAEAITTSGDLDLYIRFH